nr:pumilio homolog 12 [Tanacetum cinerariifolium]
EGKPVTPDDIMAYEQLLVYSWTIYYSELLQNELNGSLLTNRSNPHLLFKCSTISINESTGLSVTSQDAQTEGTLREALVEAIKPHVPALRTSPYGKKVLSSNGLKK